MPVTWIRNQRVFRVDVSPFQYNPESGSLTWYPEIRLRVDFGGDLTLPEFFRHKFRKSNAVFRELLRFSYRLPETDGRDRRSRVDDRNRTAQAGPTTSFAQISMTRNSDGLALTATV